MKLKLLRLACAFIAASFATLVSVPARADTPDSKKVETGIASYYGDDWQDRRTANGERFNPEAFTAAHRNLPLGAWVKVTNLINGRSINVRINDRNAPSHTRIIDLSKAAADAVGMLQAGLAKVKIERILPPGHRIAMHEPPHKPVYN